jgi:predicted metal-dependent enzyme (double-stranded beta helix superfamily)
MSVAARSPVTERILAAGADVLAVTPEGQLLPRSLAHITSTISSSPDLWTHLVRFDPTTRYFTRLHRSEIFEVWLICWDHGQDTLLHDHGGSVGAFTVASGALLEDFGSTRSTKLRTRTQHVGDSTCFGRDYLHNLVNRGLEPAVSIHAYSAPLTKMNFYRWRPSGMHHIRTLPCESGEPDARELEHAVTTWREA